MDATSWTIICAMATAIMGISAFVKMLWVDLRECQKARVKALEEQLSLVKTTAQEIVNVSDDKTGKSGGGS